MEQHDVQEPGTESNLIQAGKSLSNLKPKLPTIPESEENYAGGMDCHICLDVVQDPVVTFCGHLYCWPCIYKWMNLQTVPSGMADHHHQQQQQQHPQCPVCKGILSKETLIPLYGRGLTSPKSPANGGSNGNKGPEGGIVIPQRPPSPRCDGGFSHQTVTSPTTATINSRAVPQLHLRTNENRHPYPISGDEMDSLSSSSSPTNNNNNNYYNVVQQHHPIVGVLCDLTFTITKMFGIPETSLHSDIMDRRRSPRMRRQLMKIDRSLSRVSFFLLCCVIFCLLVF